MGPPHDTLNTSTQACAAPAPCLSCRVGRPLLRSKPPDSFGCTTCALFERMYPHRNDREKFIAVAKQGRQLKAQMRRERESLAWQGQPDWPPARGGRLA